MNLRNLTTRVSRIEQHRGQFAFQASWDRTCDQQEWPRSSLGDATCIEDLLRQLVDEPPKALADGSLTP